MLQQFFLLPATSAVDTVTMSKWSWLSLGCFRVLTFVQTTSQLWWGSSLSSWLCYGFSRESRIKAQ